MSGNKLFQILKTFEKGELKRLRKVFESPYFVTNVRLLTLFEYLRKCYPEFEPSKVSKEKLFQKLYPGQKFNDGLLRVVLREFTAAVEEFMLIERLRRDNFQKKRQLTREYGLRNIYPIFERETKALQTKLEKEPYRDADYFREMASLNFDYFFHPMTQKLTLEDEALTDLMDSIDKQFALTKYRIGSELKNRERILAKKYEQRFLEAIDTEGENGFLSENPTAKIYRSLFDLYQPQPEEHFAFYSLKILFLENIGALKRWDKAMVATQLMNYAARQINSGNSSFNRDMFDIYKMGLEHDFIIDDNKINGVIFSNIVSVGCAIEEFEWTSGFIDNYKDFLYESEKAETVLMSTGFWHYSQKEYEKALDYYNYQFSDPINQTTVRMYTVRIYFERYMEDNSNFHFVISQFENFEKFLHRNSLITENRKKSNLNLVAILKKLTNDLFQNKNSATIKDSIQAMIAQKKLLTGKKWILEKLETI